MQQKILITGSNGQLGKSFQSLASQNKAFNFVFADRSTLDITDTKEVLSFFNKHDIAHCINCAAYTKVDLAEENVEDAYKINSAGTENLAVATKLKNGYFVHISTDYVFDGTKCSAYTENDKAVPLNVYGASKLEGEDKALSNNERTIILRVSWLYSEFNENFLKKILQLQQSHENLKVVNDQIGTPTYARDLANQILEWFKLEHKPTGLFHFSNEGIATWYDFAYEILRCVDSRATITPVPTETFPRPAKRPSFSLLDKTNIKQKFGTEIRHWKAALTECIQYLK